ncbi:MAG TPA: CZB domain-containing protein [Rhodocyclaceae bacterium]|nr:CZB domain-containing protein [Rhodocyclaceae bacterium]
MKSEIDWALEAHSIWLKKFRDFLNGRVPFDVTRIGVADQCDFGEWLDKEAYRLIPKRLHKDICTTHTAFHRIAAELVQKIREKRFAEAHEDIAPDGQLNQASEQLAKLLLKATRRKPLANASAQEEVPANTQENPSTKPDSPPTLPEP